MVRVEERRAHRDEGRELTEKGEEAKRKLFEYSFMQKGNPLSLKMTCFDRATAFVSSHSIGMRCNREYPPRDRPQHHMIKSPRAARPHPSRVLCCE